MPQHATAAFLSTDYRGASSVDVGRPVSAALVVFTPPSNPSSLVPTVRWVVNPNFSPARALDVMERLSILTFTLGSYFADVQSGVNDATAMGSQGWAAHALPRLAAERGDLRVKGIVHLGPFWNDITGAELWERAVSAERRQLDEVRRGVAALADELGLVG